jgi:VIT family
MPQTPHVEKHFISSETIRDVVIGMPDGLTVPFALAAGLSGVVQSTGIVITAGLAEVAAAVSSTFGTPRPDRVVRGMWCPRHGTPSRHDMLRALDPLPFTGTVARRRAADQVPPGQVRREIGELCGEPPRGPRSQSLCSRVPRVAAVAGDQPGSRATWRKRAQERGRRESWATLS